MKKIIKREGYLIGSVQMLYSNIGILDYNKPSTIKVLRIGYYKKYDNVSNEVDNKGYDFFHYDNSKKEFSHNYENPNWSYSKLHGRLEDCNNKELHSIVYDDESTEVIISTTCNTKVSLYMNDTIKFV